MMNIADIKGSAAACTITRMSDDNSIRIVTDIHGEVTEIDLLPENFAMAITGRSEVPAVVNRRFLRARVLVPDGGAREPERIERILGLLGDVWRSNPDVTLLSLLRGVSPVGLGSGMVCGNDADLIAALESIARKAR